MGKGGGGGIAGYRYTMALHLGLCRGPIDSIFQIVGDDADMGISEISDDSDGVIINQPNLYGGDDKQGGVVGGLCVMFGKPTQDIHARTVIQLTQKTGQFANLQDFAASAGASIPGKVRHLTEWLTGKVSSFRGFASVFFYGQICSNNPYPKAWKFRVRRAESGWASATGLWYPAKAIIWAVETAIPSTLAGKENIRGMNPAHILYQAITDTMWGRGLPESHIDQTSFTSAANTLCDEVFPLCIKWSRADGIDVLIQTVLDHIAGVLYVDRQTGLIALRLLRDDYDANTLPVFSATSGMLSIEEDESTSTDVVYNEIIVNYHSPVDDGDHKVRAQNVAAMQAGNAIFSKTTDYSGIPTSSLALRVAQRDLMIQAAGVRRFKLVLDRRGWKLNPGDVIRLNDPTRGIANMVLRVGTIQEASLTAATITISAVQDVFGLTTTAYTSPPEVGWEPPDRTPVAATVRNLREASYRDVCFAAGADEAAKHADDSATPLVLAQRPSPLSANYLLYSHVGSADYTYRSAGAWTPVGAIAGAIGLLTTSITLTDLSDPGSVTVGAAAMIDDEVIRVDDIDFTTMVVTIARGCADTLPAEHAAGSLIWFTDDGFGNDGQDYVSGETVYVKLLSQNSTSILPFDDAPEDSLVLDQRFGRPYPPGRLYLGANPYTTPFDQSGDIVFTWAHRNRVTQEENLIDQTETDQAPETGQTYTVRVYNAVDDTLVRTVTGITDHTWTYDSTMSTADGSLGRLRFELESARDGLASAQHYSVTVNRETGYNRNYNHHYNGG